MSKTLVLTTCMLLLVVAEAALAGPIGDANRTFEREDYAAARELLHRLADQGDPDAQFKLGVAFRLAKPADYEMARVWFKKAAEQGDARAQNGLGI